MIVMVVQMDYLTIFLTCPSSRCSLKRSNPVPVNGIPMNKVYLSRLLTSDGFEIEWKRRGSRSVSNIEYPVDTFPH